MNDQEQPWDLGRGGPDRGHDENLKGAAEFGMSGGRLARTGVATGSELGRR